MLSAANGIFGAALTEDIIYMDLPAFTGVYALARE
jgi:hypothetical protein